MRFRDLLDRNKGDVAFIVGNGINRYRDEDSSSSWDKLLLDLWNGGLGCRVNNGGDTEIPPGISTTEFYDIMEIAKNLNNSRSSDLAREFCLLMASWRPKSHHRNFVEWSRRNNIPVLTTNFDDLLVQDFPEVQLFHCGRRRFSDYYPWSSYYSDRELDYPTDGFGIWHINGMKNYQRSIRLGLSHYMGSVSRTRGMLHGRTEQDLFMGKNVDGWVGAHTWLHVFFNKPLVIFGLGLDQNETFLRWLLIQRKRYFSKYEGRMCKAWYVCVESEKNEGKRLFMNTMGVEMVLCNNYQEIYEDAWL